MNAPPDKVQQSLTKVIVMGTEREVGGDCCGGGGGGGEKLEKGAGRDRRKRSWKKDELDE